MTRREFLLRAAAACPALGLAAHAQPEKQPPNILLIVVDDLGWRDLGCYGRGDVFETPNIDRLAAEGMRFTQAYANCPVCSPSRAALMTGKYPARLQFTGHITAIGRHRHPEGSRILPPDDRMYLPHDEVTLAEALKPGGYISASVGKWHLGHEGYWPDDQGFDKNVAGWTHGSPPTYFHPYKNPKKEWNAAIPTLAEGGKPGEYLTDRLTDESIAFMEAQRSHPFFVYMTYYSVHTPLEAPENLVQKYEKKLAGKNTGVDPTYAAMVERMDWNVGRLLATVDRLGVAENTAVVLFSDNGGLSKATNNAPLREGKSWLYEGGIRVPLIIKWPGRVPEAAECHEPVIGADLFPTLVEMAGQKPPADAPLDGVSLRPLWEKGAPLQRDALYWYYPHYGLCQEPAQAIRKKDFKLIHFYDPPRTELYNLANDLGEQHNLANAMPEKVKELQDNLAAHLKHVGAKLHTLNPNRKKVD
jgi:arylsulfatase A